MARTAARPAVRTAAAAAVAVTALGAPQPGAARPVATAPVAVAEHVTATGTVTLPERAAAVRPATAPKAAKPVAKALAKPVAPPVAQPHGRVRWDGAAFRSPEAAMRFLVAAYNAHDDRAVRHVTTPDARATLLPMRDIAPVLRLTSCTRGIDGTYLCRFTHSTPKSSAQTGHAVFKVAPAAKPGWYMTVLEECG